MKKLLFISFSLMAYLAIGQVRSLNTKGANGNVQRMGLQSFSAICSEEKINVLWKTGSEDVDGYFTIEKSKDGINFTKVVDVPYIAINSNFADFTGTDYTPNKGISYYRLKQTDKNG